MENALLTLVFGAVASLNVFLGSFITIKLQKYFTIILGLAGGVMIGTVAFEVLPEVVHFLHEFNSEPILRLSMIILVIGVLLFHFLSKILPLHEHGHHDHDGHNHHTHLHTNKKLGLYGAVVMIAHSFIDGFGIGIGFSTSITLGLVIALAVLLHNVSDGINTATTLLINKVSEKSFKKVVATAIAAPFLGATTSQFIHIPEHWVLYYLSFFTGSILYLAISDILPHAHSHSQDKKPLIATLFGIALIFVLSMLLPHAH